VGRECQALPPASLSNLRLIGAMKPSLPPASSSSERRAVALTLVALAAAPVAAALLGLLAYFTGEVPRPIAVAMLVPAALVALAVAVGLDRALARRLPDVLDGWSARRRVAAALWCVLAVLAVANTARLGVFMTDRNATWASMFPPAPELTNHECLPAYVEAGELAAKGHDNLWDRSLYTDDPYEYPPPFAVVGRAAAEADYGVVRSTWFAIQALAFLAAVLALATWIGGRAGATALLLAPALALSTPVMVALQFGQAHLIVIAAAAASLPLFARNRDLAGGALLGFAIATKIFPGLLLVHLAVRRRWRAVFATLGATAIYVAIATIVLGTGTLEAFVTDHLPKLASGEAFPNALENHDNHSIFGLVIKLRDLGLGGDADLASKAAWLWGLVALALTVLASSKPRDRAGDAILWLGILALATLRSPFAPTYSAVTTFWLLSIWAGDTARRAWKTAALVIGWIVLLGQPPLFGEKGDIIVSLLPQAIVIAVAVLATLRRRHEVRD
jgi:alpha-1,2-mannosyltransferase